MSDNKNLTSSCCCSGSTHDLNTTVINPGTTNLLDGTGSAAKDVDRGSTVTPTSTPARRD